MKAVILAGGKGTRMGSVINDIPKPMVHISDKTVLQHQFELLKTYGITDIILTVNHLKDVIIDKYKDGSEIGLNITYYEEKTPLGTVGAIKELEHELKEDFLVLYGDVMMNVNLERLIQFHKQKESECTIVIHPNDHPYDSDLIEINEEDKVVAVYNKPHDPDKYYRNLVNAGLYIFSPVVFKYLEKGVKADFGKNIFPILHSKIRMFAYNTPEYLKDMGTPERMEQVTRDYESGKIKRSLFDNKKKAIFLDRDGVLNYDTDLIHKSEDLKLYDFTAEAIKRINKSEFLSVVVTNQSVVARNLCSLDELRIIHNKLETELGNDRAKLDAIYYCPHHPDKGYPEENPAFKIECECRKPKPGMLIEASKEFNIDLQKSIMIGDSERDILAGKAAGCTTVGVMTGQGLKKMKVLPDYFFKNLKEAVDFTIDNPFEDLFHQVNAYYQKKSDKNKPFVIAIGGNTRSGKSILSSYLKEAFSNQGLSVAKIELDNWILPEGERDNCKDVYDRFQLNIVEADISNLLLGKKISILTYSNHVQRESNIIEYDIDGADIIIIDGVIALSSEKLREKSDLKLFLEIDEDIHKQRFIDYNRWREKDLSEIEEIYQKRRLDEYQLIEKESKFADLVVKQ
jgi:D,D-heptose 1,7-bisphosphate phosphatase